MNQLIAQGFAPVNFGGSNSSLYTNPPSSYKSRRWQPQPYHGGANGAVVYPCVVAAAAAAACKYAVASPLDEEDDGFIGGMLSSIRRFSNRVSDGIDRAWDAVKGATKRVASVMVDAACVLGCVLIVILKGLALVAESTSLVLICLVLLPAAALC